MKLVKMINEAGRHINGRVTREAEAVIADFRVVKKGSASGKVVVITDATEAPLGITIGASGAAGEKIAVELLTAPGTKLGKLAADGVVEGDVLCAAADGELQKTPAAAGTYYEIARALEDGGEHDIIEVETFAPRKVVVS